MHVFSGSLEYDMPIKYSCVPRNDEYKLKIGKVTSVQVKLFFYTSKHCTKPNRVILNVRLLHGRLAIPDLYRQYNGQRGDYFDGRPRL